MEKNPLLKVDNLAVSFDTSRGEHKAVKGLSFELGSSETIGIVGESGSGKTLTCLSILGLAPISARVVSGTALFQSRDGSSIDLISADKRQLQSLRGRELGIIFQNPSSSLNPVYKCGFQVAEVLVRHLGLNNLQAKEATLELFAEVQLQNPARIFEAYPHELSGGQKQRVMIAMAMACKPRALFADEPTSSLDVTVQRAILELMIGLKEKHQMSLVFISHDLTVVRELADQILVMYEGQIVEQGRAQDVFSAPRHPYTRGLLSCRPPTWLRLKRLPTIPDFVDQEPNASIIGPGNIVSATERALNHERIYSSPPLMKVEGLETRFNERTLSGTNNLIRAVDNVSFDVFQGETLGLVGESGCGKSTLVRSLLRLIEPQKGQVIYKDLDVLKLSPRRMRAVRKELQIVFQDPYSSLNPRISIGESIIEPMKVHGLFGTDSQRRKKAQSLLEKVGLDPEFYHRYPNEFSGGQRQRACIARALASEPEFLICDESVSALDVSVQAQVLNLLNSLKSEMGFTCLFISHDLSVVKFMSDRIMVMRDGKIVEVGEADYLYSHPANEYTRSLISSIPE